MAKQTTSAADYLPERIALPTLREAVQGCRGCELYERATQAVFGEGPGDAPIVVVGEQPGDSEDVQGRPFVGQAGRVLDEGLEAAGIDREKVYVTNAVKHFKWEPRGKKRLHAKPSAREVRACQPWLEKEVELIEPRVLLALGATAAQAVLGRDFRLTRHRGEAFDTHWAPVTMATIHPSAILRMPGRDKRAQAREQFHDDLRTVAAALAD